MKRRVLLGAAGGLALGLTSSGCTGRENEEPELSFWNPLTGDDGAFMKEIIAAYNATGPVWPVKNVTAPAGDMYTRLYSVVRSQSGIPDLLLIHGPRLQELVNGSILHTIDELQEHEPALVKENYLPAAWESAEVEGKTYGIPLDLHGIIVQCNDDLVEHYGLQDLVADGIITLDDLLTLEGQLDEGHYAMTPLFMSALVANAQFNKGTIPEVDDGTVNLTDPVLAEALEKLRALVEAGLVAAEDVDSMAVFRRGDAIFMPDGTWGVSGHEAIEGLNFSMINCIQLTPDSPTNLLESHLLVQARNDKGDPERRRGVSAFLEYLRVNALTWAEAGQIVASTAVTELPAYKDFAQSVLTDPENPAQLVTDTRQYASTAGAGLNAATVDVAYGRNDIESALQKAQAEADARIEMLELA